MGKKILAITVVVALLGLVAWWGFPRTVAPPTTDNKPEPTRPVKPSPPKKSEAPLVLRYKYQAGDHLLYQINYQTDVQMGGPKKSLFSLGIAGKLHQRIYQIAAGKIYAGYTLMVTKIRVTDSNKGIAPLLGKALQTEIYARITSRGAIEKWYWPSSIRPDLRNHMKGVLVLIQMLFPEAAVKDQQWQSKETGINGKYLAAYQYRQGPESALLTISKQKGRYLPDSKPQKTVKIVASDATISFASDLGHIVQFDLSEEIKSEAMEITTQGKTTLKLKLLKRQHEPKLAQPVLPKLQSKEFQATLTMKVEGPEQLRRNMLIKLLGNRQWKDIILDIEKLQKKENKKRYELFRLLVAWMELNPDKMHLVIKKILITKDADRNMITILSALGHVHDPAAQEVLSTVIQKRQDNEKMVQMALISLGRVEKPAQASIDMLQEMYRSRKGGAIHETAIMALGNLVRKLREQDPSRAAAVIYDVEKDLQNASGARQKRVLLAALGNAGSASSLPYVASCLDSGDYTVRSRAVMALRFIPDPKVDALLAKAVEDKNLSVRNNTLEAMTYRQPSKEIFTAVKAGIGKEKNDSMRVKQARVLWAMRKQFTEAAAIVARYAERDSSPQVRKALRSMMLAAGKKK